MNHSRIAQGALLVTCPEANVASQQVKLDNLSFGYGSRRIFSEFSLSASRSRVVIKGPSGCGKTTLLRILFGDLLPSDNATLPELGRTVLVLQEDALFPWLTGRDNIRMFLAASDEQVSSHALYPVVAAFLDHRAHEMSYGQRRAVELFRALLSAPNSLLLDEPFNYLDDAKASAFIEELLSPRWDNTTVVVTSHRHDRSLDAQSSVFAFEGEAPHRRLRPLE